MTRSSPAIGGAAATQAASGGGETRIAPRCDSTSGSEQTALTSFCPKSRKKPSTAGNGVPTRAAPKNKSSAPEPREKASAVRSVRDWSMGVSAASSSTEAEAARFHSRAPSGVMSSDPTDLTQSPAETFASSEFRLADSAVCRRRLGLIEGGIDVRIGSVNAKPFTGSEEQCEQEALVKRDRMMR